ncbi:hypothetical protein QJS66_07555 [Kocuria rhizophila]|nr:hypothetical protein QJS66_07555 [Kocuria rhizophila]
MAFAAATGSRPATVTAHPRPWLVLSRRGHTLPGVAGPMKAATTGGRQARRRTARAAPQRGPPAHGPWPGNPLPSTSREPPRPRPRAVTELLTGQVRRRPDTADRPTAGASPAPLPSPAGVHAAGRSPRGCAGPPRHAPDEPGSRPGRGVVDAPAPRSRDSEHRRTRRRRTSRAPGTWPGSRREHRVSPTRGRSAQPTHVSGPARPASAPARCAPRRVPPPWTWPPSETGARQRVLVLVPGDRPVVLNDSAALIWAPGAVHAGGTRCHRWWPRRPAHPSRRSGGRCGTSCRPGHTGIPEPVGAVPLRGAAVNHRDSQEIRTLHAARCKIR